MKVGDMIWDKCDKRFGILIERDWETAIGTPFDWLVLWFDDGSLFGIDVRDIEVINEI